jgi:hypothetical protein
VKQLMHVNIHRNFYWVTVASTQMGEILSPETLVTAYKTEKRHNRHFHPRDSLKPQIQSSWERLSSGDFGWI